MRGFPACYRPMLERFNFVSFKDHCEESPGSTYLNIFNSLKLIDGNERVSLNENLYSELVQVKFSIWQVTVIAVQIAWI